MRDDIISAVGSLQVCTEHETGCKTAIHNMYTISEDENTKAVPLVDAANAIDPVNRVFLNILSFSQ